MNFAVLGDDPAALPLIQAVGSHSLHRLTHAAHADAILPDLLKAAPAMHVSEGWEHLLIAADIDAVVVSGHSAVVQEGVKQLAAAETAVVLFPDVDQGLTLIYELGMLSDEKGCLLFPVFPKRHHPNVLLARELIIGGALGQILHLHLERQMHLESSDELRPLPTLRETDSRLLPDIDLLRMLGGNYSQVTALRSSQTEGVSRATVNLTGDDLPEASWSLNAAAPGNAWTLTVTGQRGSLVLRGADDSETIAIETDVEPQHLDHTTARAQDVTTGDAILAQFDAAIAGDPYAPDWIDLTRAFEILDAAHRSVNRRRTIDLFFETTSERSIFKTQMTAVGCGLMSATLFAVVLLLFAATLIDPRGSREAQSEAAGFIVYSDEFVAGSAELTPAGKAHVERIVGPFSRSRTWVLIEQRGTEVDELEERRKGAVLETLAAGGADSPEQRTQVAQLRGKWFLPAMRIVRVAVFAPLFLYLALQLLLFVARPASGKTKTPAPGDAP